VRRAASMSPVLQGSALRRASDPAATKFPFDGAPDAARETLSVLLDSGSAASIPDESDFAGSALRRAPAQFNRTTAIHSRERPRFVRKGLKAPYAARVVGFRQHGESPR
jgi:hypothetical protein